jgi:hypothetical protein
MNKWERRGVKATRLKGEEQKASGSERFVWNVLLLPELFDQPIPYFREIPVLGRPRDHRLVE